MTSLTASGFAPVAQETGEQLQLAMQRLWLEGELLPAGGRLRIVHFFRSGEERPLEAVYAFMLPRDAALRRFRVTGDGFSVRSELREAAEARQVYEEGLSRGHLATLAEQYADGLVNLTVGNIRPGEEIRVYLEILAGVEHHDSGFRFRFPFTVAPGYHSRMRVAAPQPGRLDIELPEDEFGDLILPAWREDASALHQVGFELTVRLPGPIREIASPSHNIRVAQEEATRSRVSLAPEADVPDRDLILDVASRQPLEGALSGVDKSGKGRFVAFIPSTRFGPAGDGARRVVFVLDRSGSMNGPAIEQARRALLACLGALREDDQFGIVAFDDAVEPLAPALMPATAENRQRAREFLEKVDARGGTELAAGLEAGARLLRGGPGDLMVITDGQVFGTESVLARARNGGVRLHCLGIGAASQDRFLTLLARRTGGSSRFVSVNERVDVAALGLFAGVARPVAEQISVKVRAGGGDLAPEPPRSVFPGSPLVVYGSLAGSGAAALEISWRRPDGPEALELPFEVGDGRLGEIIRLLAGARLLTDLEAEETEGDELGVVDRRGQKRRQALMARLSQECGLASRAMALVAVVEREGDQAGVLPETRVLPVGLPRGVGIESYGGRSGPWSHVLCCYDPVVANDEIALCTGWPAFDRSYTGVHLRLVPKGHRSRTMKAAQPARLEMESDRLIEQLARLEPDGGLPGATSEERILASICLLLRLIRAGGPPASSPYRAHIERLIEFLRSVTADLESTRRRTVSAIVRLAESGQTLGGSWPLPPEAITPSTLWPRLERALAQKHRAGTMGKRKG